MAKKAAAKTVASSLRLEKSGHRPDTTRQKPSPLLDTRVVYCDDNLKQLGPCRTGQLRGETKEKSAFEDRHENTKAYIDYMRPRCVQLARVLKKTGSFYYHCDWHASHHIKVMLDRIFGENNFFANNYLPV
jgi:hypothetical protein